MKTNQLPSVILCVLYSVLFNGCATMYAPSSDKITINTIPTGADVYYGAHLLGKTPLTYSFKRETFEQKKLDIRMDGYKNQELALEKTLEKTALFNLGFITTTFGATSWGIDAATGNMIKYSPDSYLVDLEKNNSSNQKYQTRLQRLRFVVLNQDHLMKDIADGDGEYLRTYFESRAFNITFDNYQVFLNHVSRQAPMLLSANESIVFYNNLENMLSYSNP
jgi:hypothetical protein